MFSEGCRSLLTNETANTEATTSESRVQRSFLTADSDRYYFLRRGFVTSEADDSDPVESRISVATPTGSVYGLRVQAT